MNCILHEHKVGHNIIECTYDKCYSIHFIIRLPEVSAQIAVHRLLPLLSVIV